MNAALFSLAPHDRDPSLVRVLIASFDLLGARASAANPPPHRSSAMKTFVILFRQSDQVLAPSDLARRSQETGAWARNVNAAGHKLDPRILGAESEIRAPENRPGVPETGWPVTALLFVEAQDLGEATRIAEDHPARRYGSAIEVRPWAPPVPAARPASAATT